jgi:hypothetical protein
MIMFLPEKKRVAKSADDDHGYKEEEIITPEMQQTEHKLRV